MSEESGAAVEKRSGCQDTSITDTNKKLCFGKNMGQPSDDVDQVLEIFELSDENSDMVAVKICIERGNVYMIFIFLEILGN